MRVSIHRGCVRSGDLRASLSLLQKVQKVTVDLLSVGPGDIVRPALYDDEPAPEIVPEVC